MFSEASNLPVRSINLKLIIPRGPDGRDVRQAAWTTHAEINGATSYYERWLLLLRGQGYQRSTEASDAPTVIPADVVQGQALQAARTAQRANLTRDGAAAVQVGTDGDVLAALRSLYDLLAPEETGTGSAQAANGYLSPLTDPNSRGFGAAAAKLDRPRPNWLSLADDDPALLEAANAWFKSNISTAWRSDTGSPAGWLRAARAGNPNWPHLFRKKLDDLSKVAKDGPEAVMARLRALRLLPLFAPYFPSRMTETGGALTPWDRLAFRLAVAHILSWQAWVRRAAEQHAERARRLQTYQTSTITGCIADLLPSIKEYERHRAEALGTLGLGAASYTLRPRQLRGWDDLRRAWLGTKDQSPDALRNIIASHQAKKRGRFGDPQVFLWLSQAPQHRLWLEADVPSIAATLNSMQALVDRSRETAIMTLPDARLHPRAVQWSAEGDSNLRPYRLLQVDGNRLAAECSLLRVEPETQKLADVRLTFRLAGNRQFDVTAIVKRGKKAQVSFASGGENFTGIIGSADLLFDRMHLQSRRAEELDDGDIGPAWLKVAVDLDETRPGGWTDDHARFTRHFAAALGTATKVEGAVAPGQRVLSVDLGVRAFAACSVFVLADHPTHSSPGKAASMSFPVSTAGQDLWAVHERSFLIDLPGEQPGAEGQRWRTEARTRLRRIRSAINHYRGMARLAGLPPGERPATIDALQAAIQADDPLPFQQPIVEALRDQASLPDPLWTDAVATALSSYRQGLGPNVRAWRRQSRERQSFNHLGKSMWAIEYLTDLRRTLMTWSLLGRASGEVRRLSRTTRGTFASGLLRHLNNIKDDRLKTGADLIVRSALGFTRDSAGRWAQRFPPCNAVLFEDLSRYRMRTDRPRRENSQLMRWAHRAIPAEVAMQGALYSLAVIETSAAFSSRYHAQTLTPGLRCKRLTRDDLSNEWLRQDLQDLGIDLAACRQGDLVPVPGGDTFACLKKGGGLLRANADINAAQNLQRRFWSRHGDAFRLPCVRADSEVWVPRSLGKRLLGALGGPGVLRPTGHPSGSCRWEPTTALQMRRLGGGADNNAKTADDPEIEDLAALIDEAEINAGRVEVFFRDPSGIVLTKDLWYPAKTAWSVVRARTVAELRANLGNHRSTV